MKTVSSTPKTIAPSSSVRPPTTAKDAPIPTATVGQTRTVGGAFRTAQMPLQVNPHNGWTPTMTGMGTTSKGIRATTVNSAVVTLPLTASDA